MFCAGILSTVPEWTVEGLERNFVLNYLTRYLLARRLLPALTGAKSGRLVLVSNAGMYKDTLSFDDLQHRKGKPGMKVAGRTQFLAQDPRAIGTGGRFYGPRLKQRPVPARAQRPERRHGLWVASEDLVRSYLPSPAVEDVRSLA